ncbi:hypothetical protein PS684_00137 [Pseudomonas fluorescens]|jgi:hypothetical protein|nr:hypothetical protein PS681_00978 [Pseudomonas fluorescens]VVN49966.1 hypothetical protein PS684_00137 [Pseudomonas fluorescens]
MIGTISGQALNLAKMHIANYCLALKNEAGAVDVVHVVVGINDRFKLVNTADALALANDVNHFYLALLNQQVEEISRGGYWKFKAITKGEALIQLTRELTALGA